MPDWKDAPEWANYLAMDEDGDWYWYEKRPVYSFTSGMWDSDKGQAIMKAGHSPTARLSLMKKP